MNIIWFIVHVIELILFIYLGFAALYIFIFSFSSLFHYRPIQPLDVKNRKFAVLIPGYKEDAVIIDVARQALNQDYPKAFFEVVIIADSFKTETLLELRKLPITVVEVSFEKSTKSKALNAAMKELGDDFEVALVLDADNVMAPDVISLINLAFERDYLAVQGHRVAKNLNTNMAVLDAVSEEINNSIFRKGHRVLGLSSALIGSGMAFNYAFFKTMMLEIKAVGGFDKELELRLLKDRNAIEYIPEALIYDEKVQKAEVFANQRKRWLSAQFVYFRRFAWSGVKALVSSGNVDFADKVYQMIQPPRILLLGIISLLALIMGGINLLFPFWMWTHLLLDFPTWLVIWVLTVFAFAFAIPKQYYSGKTAKALIGLPKGFILMFLSLFKLRGANKRFIHTSHGVGDANVNANANTNTNTNANANTNGIK